jgi:hypothetical protein
MRAEIYCISGPWTIYTVLLAGVCRGFKPAQNLIATAIFRLMCNCKPAGLFIATGMLCTHGLINYIDNKAKCRHLKKLTYKEGLCGRCLSEFIDW